MFYIELHTEGNHMMSDTSKTPVPIANLRAESEASHLIQISKAIDDKHPIGEIEVKSKEQPHMSLGNYTSAHPPKGFAIHISPVPEPDAIVTQITSLGDDEKYELVLHVANYGNKMVSVEVWKL
jgi:hypothetical protein